MCLGLPELVTVRWRMIWTQALMALHWREEARRCVDQTCCTGAWVCASHNSTSGACRATL